MEISPAGKFPYSIGNEWTDGWAWAGSFPYFGMKLSMEDCPTPKWIDGCPSSKELLILTVWFNIKKIIIIIKLNWVTF